jgi:hypothetical protein
LCHHVPRVLVGACVHAGQLARGGWMAGVSAEPSRLLAPGLGKIEVIMLFGKGRKKLRLFVFWSDHNCSRLE